MTVRTLPGIEHAYEESREQLQELTVALSS